MSSENRIVKCNKQECVLDTDGDFVQCIYYPECQIASDKRKYDTLDYKDYHQTVMKITAKKIAAHGITEITDQEIGLIDFAIRSSWERLWQLRAIEDGHREESE